MQEPRLGALVLISAACALGCGRKPGRGQPIPPAKDSGVALPSLDGLGLTKVGSPDDDPPGAEKWLRKVTVDVPAEASPKIMDARDASQWRGMTLPRDEGVRSVAVKGRHDMRVKVEKSGRLTLNRIACKDLAELGKRIVELRGRAPDLDVVLDAARGTPYGNVLPVMAVMAERGIRFNFQAPAFDPTMKRLGELFQRLAKEAKGALRDRAGLPNVCVRIRADARAPWLAVQGVMIEAMRAYVWRLSFVGLVGGKEVEVGPPYTKPDEPQQADDRSLYVDEEIEIVDVPEAARELDMSNKVERPVIVREEEVVELPVDREEPRPEDAISDIPLGGTGAPGIFDIAYGFRSGGGRRRAALRGGGSKSSENAVDSALKWLVRSQAEDGRWAATEFGGAEGMDVAATALATLAFLGAGHREKSDHPRYQRYQEIVRRAVKWLIRQQAGDGRIGGGTVKPGLQHAIAGLALAEAYGMAGVPTTKAAAQEAVDYSINVHQVKYSGWGYEPKAEPSTHVTGWFVMQLKMSLIAGLRVEGLSLAGAISWLDKVTEKATQRVSNVPGEATKPAPTAVAALCLQMTGWKRDHPRLLGAADYLAADLPAWKKNADLHYWYWGTLAMFQMGGGWWKMWNKAMRDMLVERQRRGLPDIDGSWDPMGGPLKDTGRVGSTAMAAMCLEVYYRYLPLYK